MRLNEIEVTGWMPFGETVRLVLPAGPIAVVGMHGEDARRSNRAGKTSLLEAITWCLFGTHRKRLEDQIIHRGSDECSVTVWMDGLTVVRTRARGSSTKLKAHVLTSDSATVLTGEAAQQAIIAATGLELDDYVATSCFPQGDVEAIISRSASERLSLVSDWLQQGRWIEARQLQVKKTNAATARLNEARGACDNAASYLLDETERRALGDEGEALSDEIDKLEAQLNEIQERLASGQLAKHCELGLLRDRARELREQLKGRAEAERLRAELLERERVAHSASDAAQTDLDATTKVRQSGFDGTCPVMCSECPVAGVVTETVQGASDLYETRLQASSTARRAWRLAAEALAPAARKASEFDRLAAEYQQAIDRGKKLASELTITDDEARTLANESSRVTDIKARHAAATARRAEISTQIQQSVRSAKRYEQLEEKFRELERVVQVSQLAQRAITAIPARIAAQQLGELEREANLLLEGTGVSLRFSLWRDLADWAPTCEQCGYVYESKRSGRVCPDCSTLREKKKAQELEILCDDGSGVEEDVRFNSGGTRAIVGSAIRLAASAMLRRLRSSQAAWAIVDEPFGSLDAENREQLARTFAGMLGSVGLEQALVVSHDQALLAALPNRIVVTKDGAQSTARIE